MVATHCEVAVAADEDGLRLGDALDTEEATMRGPITVIILTGAVLILMIFAARADYWYGGQHFISPVGPRVYVPPKYGPQPWRYRPTPCCPDPQAVIGGIIGATLPELAARLPLPTMPPTASFDAVPPPHRGGDALDDVEPNPRGITRTEVEAVITDWCTSHGEAPLCQKLRVR
jgi:hypothetical protein